jgi:hypothetical protein
MDKFEVTGPIRGLVPGHCWLEAAFVCDPHLVSGAVDVGYFVDGSGFLEEV